MSDQTATGPITVDDIAPTPVPEVLSPITIDDILNTQEVLKQKELTDKALLDSIGSMSHEELKTKLIRWASSGFPNVYEVHQVSINVPSKCSDGTIRNLTDYIQFCSGKTIQEHVDILQQKATGMIFSFANMGSYIAIVVSKLS